MLQYTCAYVPYLWRDVPTVVDTDHHWYIPYAYGTYHTRIWYIPYAYGTLIPYAYGIKYTYHRMIQNMYIWIPISYPPSDMCIRLSICISDFRYVYPTTSDMHIRLPISYPTKNIIFELLFRLISDFWYVYPVPDCQYWCYRYHNIITITTGICHRRNCVFYWNVLS